jgi:hypothetical protein
MTALRCFVLSATALGVVHGFPFEPSQEFIDIARLGCRWESSWPASHRTHEEVYATCLGLLGLREGSPKEIAVWSPPPAIADPRQQSLSCARAAIAEVTHLDECMFAAGFTWSPGESPPYRRQGTSPLEARSQVRTCASAIPDLSSGFTHCVHDAGWGREFATR